MEMSENTNFHRGNQKNFVFEKRALFSTRRPLRGAFSLGRGKGTRVIFEPEHFSKKKVVVSLKRNTHFSKNRVFRFSETTIPIHCPSEGHLGGLLGLLGGLQGLLRVILGGLVIFGWVLRVILGPRWPHWGSSWASKAF